MSDRLEQVVAAMMERTRAQVEAIRAKCESPIESLLLFALLDEMGGFVRPHLNGDVHSAPGDGIPSQEAMVFDVVGGASSVTIIPQLEVETPAGNYRLDLFVHVRTADGRGIRIAVECDGHNFHERTPEQAERDKARDRALQTIRFNVARFTGSEIVRDPAKAARDVWAFVSSLRAQREKEIT